MTRIGTEAATGAGVLAAGLLALVACSDAPARPAGAAPGDGGVDAAAADPGEELRVPVGEGQRVHVALASRPSVVAPADPRSDRGWDLAFEGLDVFTNSGPSGPGAASAFGPLEPIVVLAGTSPAGPVFADRTGGAFVRWYLYEGPPNHALFSRFHVYGVRDGARLYRVQILAYDGIRDGVSVSALYRIRYGEVGQRWKEAVDLDATASSPEVASECIDLGTDARAKLTAAEARASSAWHLCFRRQDVAVNGESGGPRGVGAVDLDADRTAAEKLDEVAARTPESELARFEAVTAASFDGRSFRGDRVISAFTDLWTKRGAAPPAPEQAAWVVVGADGRSRYLVGFARFEGASTTTPGTVVMRVKSTPPRE
jgi:hypothetical protein